MTKENCPRFIYKKLQMKLKMKNKKNICKIWMFKSGIYLH